MINQTEIPMYLEEAFPEIAGNLSVNNKNNVYEVMDTLTSFTCNNIRSHHFSTVKRCFQIAEKLYEKGNTVVKNAVQNVFVYSFTKMFHTYSAEKPQLLSIIPITLYSLYITQVHHGGC